MHRPKAAEGRSERWELLGEVDVDGASMGIIDPTYLSGDPVDAPDPIPVGSFGGTWSQGGIWFHPGLGDGGYEVWGRVVDYGSGSGLRERLAEIRVVMISEADITEWHLA